MCKGLECVVPIILIAQIIMKPQANEKSNCKWKVNLGKIYLPFLLYTDMLAWVNGSNKC